MSTVVTTPTPIQTATSVHAGKPSFFGLVRGELFKVRHQWSTWIMMTILALAIIGPYIIFLSVGNLADQLRIDPLHELYTVTEVGLTVLRIFSGFFLLAITAIMIVREYQLGTIRILLARGVGRLQLLCAKLLATTIVGLLMLIGGIALTALMVVIVVAISAGNLNALQSLNSQFWSDTWMFVITLLVNMGATILLATAAAVIGRSSAFGLAAALVFFPLDNIGTGIMQLAFLITHNDFWLNLTAYFLGPNLNAMPHVLVNTFRSVGATPLSFLAPDPANPTAPPQLHGIVIDGTHTLVVALVYAVIFATVAIVLTWKRDVKE